MAVRGRSCLVNSCKISNFGAKPVRGGRPPKDRKIKGVSAVRAGSVIDEVASEFKLVVLEVLNVRNAEVVIII